MDTIHKLFQETIQKTMTTDRISYMVLKKLISVHDVILSKKQIDQMSKDLVASGSINIKIKKTKSGETDLRQKRI